MRIVAATGNPGKLKEIREIIEERSREPGGEILSGCQVVAAGDLGLRLEQEENGTTFRENARIKCSEIYEKLLARKEMDATIVLSDDSGLCIDALNGAPGVLSARFLGSNTPYDVKNEKLLGMLKEVPQEKRTARYECDVCAVGPAGRYYHSTGISEGCIARRASVSGKTGFGYDPVFFLPEYGKTMSELEETEKNKISHRGRALRGLDYPALLKD